jgi:hypothetical protein
VKREDELLALFERRPALVIRLPLESDRAVLAVDAATFEDELRLRHWLRHTRSFRALRLSLTGFLDELDREEAA